jgi:hypothetical protein
MSDSSPGKIPQAQPASAGGGPQQPPKKTVRGLDDPSPEDLHIDIPDRVVLGELAVALKQKQFRIIADVMELGRFAIAGDPVDFDTAARIAKKYGFKARPSS